MNVCRKVMDIFKLKVTNIVLKTWCCLNHAFAVCASSAIRVRRRRRRRKRRRKEEENKRLHFYNPLPGRDIYLCMKMLK
jgi:hypothetical protein